MLAIEAYNGEARPGYADLEAPHLQVKHQIVLLHEAGFIQAMDAAPLKDRLAIMPIRLTMAGCEYFETFRDEEVWRRTKESSWEKSDGDPERALGRLFCPGLAAGPDATLARTL